MALVNAHFSVDTFLVITGTLVVYSFMKIDHQKHKFNPFLFYLHRYLRSVPTAIYYWKLSVVNIQVSSSFYTCSASIHFPSKTFGIWSFLPSTGHYIISTLSG